MYAIPSLRRFLYTRALLTSDSARPVYTQLTAAMRAMRKLVSSSSSSNDSDVVTLTMSVSNLYQDSSFQTDSDTPTELDSIIVNTRWKSNVYYSIALSSLPPDDRTVNAITKLIDPLNPNENAARVGPDRLFRDGVAFYGNATIEAGVYTLGCGLKGYGGTKWSNDTSRVHLLRGQDGVHCVLAEQFRGRDASDRHFHDVFQMWIERARRGSLSPFRVQLIDAHHGLCWTYDTLMSVLLFCRYACRTPISDITRHIASFLCLPSSSNAFGDDDAETVLVGRDVEGHTFFHKSRYRTSGDDAMRVTFEPTDRTITGLVRVSAPFIAQLTDSGAVCLEGYICDWLVYIPKPDQRSMEKLYLESIYFS